MRDEKRKIVPKMRAMRSAALAFLSSALALGADPSCKTGIQDGTVCCAASCGTCSGPGCSKLPGGADACCGSHITSADKNCAQHDPPCVIGGAPTPAPPPPIAPTPAPAPGGAVAVTYGGGAPIFTVAPEYVSFNLDASESTAVLQDATLEALAAALAPAHLRVGGTQQDYSVYAGFDSGSGNASCAALPAPMTDYRCREFTVADWTALLGWVERNGLTLIFGLNDMFGRPTKRKPEKPLCTAAHGCPARDQSNLGALLAWTAAHASSARIFGWELGNELNSCLNDEVGAKAQAADFAALRKLAPAAHKLIGPDTHSSAEFSSTGRAWFEAFVAQCASQAAANRTVDAYTFHMYSLGNGPQLDPEKLGASYLSAAALDKSHEGGAALAAIVAKHHGSDAPASRPELWAGETAAANDGGQSGITDTFIDGFWYLDQLGGLAANNVSVFQRQVLYSSGGYPMVEGAPGAMAPLPDYWIALLHKRLAGTRVLRAATSDASVRAYAHCAAPAVGAPAGAVTVALLNIGSAAANVSFASAGGDAPEQARVEYVLTAGEKAKPSYPNALQSKQALLNGKLLQLSGGALPAIDGKAGAAGEPFVMPPTSYGFVVLPDAKAAACM